MSAVIGGVGRRRRRRAASGGVGGVGRRRRRRAAPAPSNSKTFGEFIRQRRTAGATT
jgi:hypothetical protein